MNIEAILFPHFVSVFESILFIVFASFLLKKKPKMPTICFLLVLMLIWGIHLYSDFGTKKTDFGLYLLSLLPDFLALCILFEGSTLEKCYIAVNFSAFSQLAQSLSFVALYKSNPFPFEQALAAVEDSAYLSVLYIFILLLCILASRLCIKHNVFIKNKLVWSFLIILPAASTLICWYTFPFGRYNMKAEEITLLSWITILLLAFNFFVLITCRIISIAAERKMQKQLLDITLQDYQLYTETILKSHAATKDFRHDLQKHLQMIQTLLYENKFAAVKQYIHDYTAKLDKLTIRRFTGNAIIDIAISQYADVGILIETEGLLPETLPYSLVDISALIGNILENAVNASKDIPFAKVKIYVQFVDRFICRVTNPVSKDYPYMVGSKRGLFIIENIVEKYYGEFRVELTDTEYSIFLVLPNLTNDEAKRGQIS